MSGQQPALRLPVDFFLHDVVEHARARELEEHALRVAEIEEVALPLPLEIAAVLEPRAADAFDDVRRAVLALERRSLAPEADHGATLFVDDHVVVRILPVLEAFHLVAER